MTETKVAINALVKISLKNLATINKSLSLIVLLELSGWISNYAIRIIMDIVNADTMVTWYVVQVCGYNLILIIQS